MQNAIAQVPPPINEPVRDYAPGSPERASLQQRLKTMKAEQVDIPVIIGGERIRTGDTATVNPPHETAHKLGTFHQANEALVRRAIDNAVEARHDWARMPWDARAAIFLKAAELLAGPWRDTLNAATMLGQSKSVYQAEIDAACEMIDFFRFNAKFMEELYAQQPISSPGMWNRTEYRPLEGFVFAVTPFNFTAIGGNLAGAPAMMGNTVLWKPASTSVLSNYYTYLLLEEAGLPPGVINFLPGSGPTIGDPTFASEHLGGLHFTGSTGTFQHMWKVMADNLPNYRSYPRIVGETGGKDFILAHPSADAGAVATAIVRGSFEYQGQKCSAASRVYVPENLWPTVRTNMLDQLSSIRMGGVEDFSNFVNAVIDKKSFDNITGYIKQAKQDEGTEIIYGGRFSDEEGYFIEPTVIQVEDPNYRTMCEEIFGPVVTVYVYPESKWHETLKTVDQTSPYALTGAIFSQDRPAAVEATDALMDSAGNFYINDKPTGAVVGQQPFGGSRASGTNDKAGSLLNLTRWVSARSIKETFVPAQHYGYPFLGDDTKQPSENGRNVVNG